MEENLKSPLFEQAVAWYDVHKEELREKYHGKYLVITGNKVIGAYPTNGDAWRTTLKTEKPGNFMIHFVPENPEDEIYYLSPLAYA